MNYEAVYVHIPFCKQKCLYCDFSSYAGCSSDTMDAYVRALCKEIRLKRLEARKVSQSGTIFFGGGTPSVLSADNLRTIVSELKNAEIWNEPKEATIEVNPGTADLKKLTILREIGFDRISFGVQSLNDDELKAIGRIHSAKEALEAINMAKDAGFRRINADIMYGLPMQTLESLQQTLDRITSTGIEHISAYSLILEEGTPLEKLVDSGKVILPDEELTADMYDIVQKILNSKGYRRYEVSNYARCNGESEHNKVYWTYHPYLAFGAAACSFNGKERFTATSDVNRYIKKVNEFSDNFDVSSINCSKELYEIEKLSHDDLIAEYMFMGLRTVSGANLTEAKERFGIDILQKFAKELEPFFADNLLVHDVESNYLRLTDSGMAIGNLVFEVFVK